MEMRKGGNRKRFRTFAGADLENGVQEVGGSNPLAPIKPEELK